jgi:molecular chaperone GrpE (heat shock protein)
MSEEVKNDTFAEQESAEKIEETIETMPTGKKAPTEKDISTIEAPHQEDDLLTILKDNRNLLQEIRDTIQNRLEYDAVKEKAIDRIGDELKFYRDGYVFQSQKSIFIDLMLLFDGLARILDSLDSEEVFSKEKLRERLEFFKEELLEILYRRDIVPFDEHPEYLNHKLHKTIKTIPTDVESENNKIDKIIKIGFRLKDKILRPEEVIIKKYVK